MRALAVWCVGALLGVEAARPLPCPAQRELFATYERLEDSLSHFVGLYSGYARARPKVLAEHVKAFQLRALGQDLIDILDSFRLLACLTMCPVACHAPGESVEQAFAKVQLVERLNNLQLDLELVVTEESFEFRAPAQQLMREAKQYATRLVATAPLSGGGGVDWDEALTVCVAQIISRVMFPLMKVVAMSAKHNESSTISSGVTLDADNPASMSASYVSPACGGHRQCAGGGPDSDGRAQGEPSFQLLRSLATGLGSFRLASAPGCGGAGLCFPETSPHLLSASAAAWPRRWRRSHSDVDVPTVLQMLELVESSTLDLSHSILALRPIGSQGWGQNLSCTGTGLDYDPSLCLEDLGWGGHVYFVNVHPPFRAEMRVLGRRLADISQTAPTTVMDLLRPHLGQQRSQTVSMEHLYYRLDFLWRQSHEPSPDVFFLHPATHNCHGVEYLFTGAPLKPKVLIIPINPLIPPPFEVRPRFDAWWHVHRRLLEKSSQLQGWVNHDDEEAEDEQGKADVDPGLLLGEYVLPSFWFAQCSLAAVDEVMRGMEKKKWKYDLHHVDGAYAVYIRRDLQRALSPKGAAKTSAFAKWLEGWHCSPFSRFFSRLEVAAGGDVQRLGEPDLGAKEKEAILCRFLDAQRIPVQKRNFDCAGVVGTGSMAATGDFSCLKQDTRGWGNEGVVMDTVQESPRDCEDHCLSMSCSYWTFDPTSMYGQPLCWIWKGGRPAEIRVEKGWISGDVDCRRDFRLVLNSGNTQEDSPPMPSAPARRSADDEASRRASFQEWAVHELQELPGTRYLLESGGRGRCVRGFCECFPPFRGPLCEQLEHGRLDNQRNFSAVLHYLTSDDDTDIADIQESLPRLWRQYNRHHDYPVVIFHDGLSEEHRRQVVAASTNRIWFAFVDDYLEVPEMLTKDPSRKAALEEVKWSLGYRGMCRFRSGTIFLQPVLRGFEYAMTLDTDGYFPAEVVNDPIAQMHNGEYVYTFSHLLPDLPGAVKHFWDYSLMYMRMKGIHPRGTEILREFVTEEHVQWNYQLYMNDIEIVRLDWFRSDPYQDYFRYLDSVGGFWLHRWGDHAVRTIAVGMWLPKDRVLEMDIPYGHQNYCRCGGAHPDLECVREGERGGKPEKWWTCALPAEDPAA